MISAGTLALVIVLAILTVIVSFIMLNVLDHGFFACTMLGGIITFAICSIWVEIAVDAQTSDIVAVHEVSIEQVDNVQFVKHKDDVINLQEKFGKKSILKDHPSFNNALTGFTYNKTDSDVEQFIKDYIIKA